MALCLFEIACHDGERLGLPSLRAAQLAHRVLVSRVAREVEPAQALDRDHLAGVEQARGLGDRIRTRGVWLYSRTFPGARQPEAGPAGRTRVRLGMEAPAPRIFILGPAFRAHRERAHRGACPIIGHAFDDGEPRPAIGAVGERIAIAPVGRVGHFRGALLARGEVGGDERGRPDALFAAADRKLRAPLRGDWDLLEMSESGEGRAFGVQPRHESLHVVRAAFHFNRDAVRPVAHPAGEVERACQAIDEGPKPDALHGAPNHDPPPETRRRRRFPLLPGWCHALPGVNEEVTAGFIIGEDPGSVKQQTGARGYCPRALTERAPGGMRCRLVHERGSPTQARVSWNRRGFPRWFVVECGRRATAWKGESRWGIDCGVRHGAGSSW